jgi:DNA-binding Xre family transcriptional regulator
MKKKKIQHATICPRKVKALMKKRGMESNNDLRRRLDEISVKNFRIDTHGEGVGSANLDTVGGICKVLKCKIGDITRLVGGKCGVER